MAIGLDSTEQGMHGDHQVLMALFLLYCLLWFVGRLITP